MFGAQVGGGDLEAVEQETGAARVDVVGGDADEEFAEGFLDGVVVGGGEEGEGAAAGEALVGTDDGTAGVVVVVAELLAAHARAAAAGVVGEDVVALEVVVGLVVVDGGFVVHGYPLFWCKVFNADGLSLDFICNSIARLLFAIKSESPGGCRGFAFCNYFYCRKWGGINRHIWKVYLGRGK